ncbi:MAG TPA: SIMPL domain-containing protein [Anaerolineales bacterium]|nr:SIMPL domain-containing protein [Anaerolineales bacterium]
MRKRMYLIIGLMLMAILLSACGAAVAQTASPSSESQPERTLTVTGNGKVFLTPDIANVSIGVHTEGTDAAEAVSTNNAQTQQVIEELKGMAVEAKDIQTTNFSIYPRQEYDNNGNLTGITYVVDNTVYVTVRDLSKIGDLLNTVVQSGANSISGIQFDVADRVKALSSARKAAVDNARDQAEELAQAAGVQLGPVQSIAISSSTPIPLAQSREALAAPAAEVPISPGQLSISVDVTVVYEIQ